MWLHYFLIIYIVLWGLVLGTGKQPKIKRRLYIILTFGLFTVLAAFRAENIGNDTVEYLRIFKDISLAGDMSNYIWRYEIGYLWLNKILSLLTPQPQIILIVTSVIIMVGFARFIYKHSQMPWLSTYLFFTLGYYGMSMNTIRLSIAIVIILFSYDYLRKQELIKFILAVILAFLFHRTAIVFLLAWPITKLKFNYKTVMYAGIGSVLIYTIFPIILRILLKIFPTYEYYLGSLYLNGEIRLASVMNLLVGISIIVMGVFVNYHKQNNTIAYANNNTLNIAERKILDGQFMTLLLVAGTSVIFISFNFNLLNRVGDYFLVFSIVYLPNAIKQLKDKKLEILIIYTVVVLFFAYSTMILIMRPEWNIIYPYNFYWLNKA